LNIKYINLQDTESERKWTTLLFQNDCNQYWAKKEWTI
jgi:hypothetical protein